MKKIPLTNQIRNYLKLFESVDSDYGFVEQDTNYWRTKVQAEPNESILSYTQKHIPKNLKATASKLVDDYKYFNKNKPLPKYFTIKTEKNGSKQTITFSTVIAILLVNDDLPWYEGDMDYGSAGLETQINQLFNEGSVPLVDGSVIYATKN